MPLIQLARRSSIESRPALHQQQIEQTAAFVFDASSSGGGAIFQRCCTSSAGYLSVEVDFAVESEEGIAGVAGKTLEEGVVEVVLGLPMRGKRGEDVVVEGTGGPAEREEGGVGEVEAYFV